MDVIIDGVRYVPACDPCDSPELLDFLWRFHDAGGLMTIREYLGKLLHTLWEEGDRFSGKRPFGNSGWEYDLYTALAKAGAVTADLDEDDLLNSISSEERAKADALVFGLIAEMCRSKQ